LTDKDVQQLADAWEALRSGPWRLGEATEDWKAKWRACKAAERAYYGLRRDRNGLAPPPSVNFDDDR
jgi:hypothetical protein